MEAIIDIGTIEVRRAQRDLWRAGGLMPEWKMRFPELFDDKDAELAESQPDYHFWEMVCSERAVPRHGLSALVEKYAYANHPRKQQIVAKLLPDEVLRVLRDGSEYGGTQGPDLLMYDPDMADWFFCKVKGPRPITLPDNKRRAYSKGFEAALRRQAGLKD